MWEQPWPAADPAFLERDTYELVCQVNGKVRDRVQVAGRRRAATSSRRCAATAPNVRAHVDGHEVVKEIVVPGQARQPRRQVAPPRRRPPAARRVARPRTGRVASGRGADGPFVAGGRVVPARSLTAGAGPALRQLGLAPGMRRPSGRVERFADVPGATITEVPIRPGLALARRPSGVLRRDLWSDRPPERSCFVASVPRGRLLTRGGLVVTADDEVVAESAWDEQQLAREFPSQRRAFAPPMRLRGTHASLLTLWPDNYYHWMIEALPRLAVLDAAGLGDVPLLVPAPLEDFHVASLAARAAGVGPERLVPHVRGHAQPDELLWPSPPTHISFPSPFVVHWLRGLWPTPGGRPPAAPAARAARQPRDRQRTGAPRGPRAARVRGL